MKNDVRLKGRKQKRKIIVYCEGEKTEPSYIKLLKKCHPNVEVVAREGSGIGCCIAFVDWADRAFGNLNTLQQWKYDQKWLMFDCDRHGDFWEAVKKARKNGFKVAFSNMCIEYWFLLHFQEDEMGKLKAPGEGGCSDRHIQMLNRHIDKYNKGRKDEDKVQHFDPEKKEVGEDFFDLMFALDPTTKERRVDIAFRRAMTIHEMKKSMGAEFQESVTAVYEFLEEIGICHR